MKWSLGFLLFACFAQAGQFTDTNLGEVGNSRVKAAFEKYAERPGGCNAGGKGRRILVTGFGRWLNSSFNISGEVARAFADDKFWPTSVRLKSSKPVGDLSKTPATVYGASVAQRSLTVDGRNFEVCSIYLDVTWDLAAAIVVKEMDRFKPDFVVMSGRGFGDGVLEGAVSNLAVGMSGYDGEGTEQMLNTPWCNGAPCGPNERSYVLPEEDEGVEAVIPLSWPHRRLAAAARRYFLQADPKAQIRTPAEPSSNNDYLCNNVSYVVAHAAKGIPVRLAGGNLLLSAKLAKPPLVGFFHYPGGISETNESVFAWARAVASFWLNF